MCEVAVISFVAAVRNVEFAWVVVGHIFPETAVATPSMLLGLFATVVTMTVLLSWLSFPHRFPWVVFILRLWLPMLALSVMSLLAWAVNVPVSCCSLQAVNASFLLGLVLFGGRSKAVDTAAT